MRFSFIIPAKNEEGALALCIKSILCQNYEEGLVEIIVIDDYSSDNTTEVAKSLGATVLTPNLPSGKTSRAQNKNLAVQFSGGDYIIFIDAHIILPSEDWLSNVAALITHNSSASNLFLASFPAIPPPELTLLLNILPREDVKAVALSVTNVRGSDQFVGGSMVISKEAFIKLGGFPAIPVSEDIGLYRNSIKNGINYKFVSELWVWHLDKRLRSTKRWLKRNLKEGFYSTTYSWEYSATGKFGNIYSILLVISIFGVFFLSIFWVVLFLLLSVNLLLQSYRAIYAMRTSNGKMSTLHLVTLITIQSMQALVLRISAGAGILNHYFLKLKSRWPKRTQKPN